MNDAKYILMIKGVTQTQLQFILHCNCGHAKITYVLIPILSRLGILQIQSMAQEIWPGSKAYARSRFGWTLQVWGMSEARRIFWKINSFVPSNFPLTRERQKSWAFLNDKIYSHTKKSVGTWKFNKICVFVYFINQEVKFFTIAQLLSWEENLRERGNSFSEIPSLRIFLDPAMFSF